MITLAIVIAVVVTVLLACALRLWWRVPKRMLTLTDANNHSFDEIPVTGVVEVGGEQMRYRRLNDTTIEVWPL
jgi:hypothetical protein